MLGIAIAAGLSVASLTSAGIESATKLDDNPWFELNGTDPLNPSDYSGPKSSPDGCETGNRVCAIQAEMDSSNQPKITPELQQEISDATTSGQPTEHVQVKN
ncbi:hypothetical protein [Sphingobacterium multivorum]|uniref:hypothetical protein n=2 Tax=Sphingobacteriaceae TaxID=84566 RepID=UPI003DA57C5F